jgi:hypothetical protein
MGLDLIEFVLAVEARFGVEIPDADAVHFRTTRTVIDYVTARVGAATTPCPCPSQQAFYRLRRALIDAVGVARGDVRPGAALEDLVPRAGRRQRWTLVAASVAAPRLHRPAWVQRAIVYPAAALSFLVFVVPPWWTLLAVAAYGSLAYVGTAKLAVEFAPDCRDVASLVYKSMAAMPPGALDEGARWTRPHVAAVVRELIAREFGVALRHPRANWEDLDFRRDLGAG